MTKRRAVLVIAVLLGALITGCMGGGSTPGSSFTLSGSVVEKGTNNPIRQAEVVLGSKTAVTTNEGRFEFEDLAAGTYTVEISVDGYNPFETQVNINQNLTGQKFELITNGPVVNINALEGISDGQQLSMAT